MMMVPNSNRLAYQPTKEEGVPASSNLTKNSSVSNSRPKSVREKIHLTLRKDKS